MANWQLTKQNLQTYQILGSFVGLQNLFNFLLIYSHIYSCIHSFINHFFIFTVRCGKNKQDTALSLMDLPL